MTFVSNPTIAVVGAGASGVIATAALLRSLRRPARVLLFDGRGSRGAGLAYGTSDPDHVLNVPASKMSAIAEEPDHFVQWLREDGREQAAAWRVSAVPDAFVPRGLYAAYLEDVLRTSLERSDPGVVLEILSEEISDLVRRAGGWRLLGRSGACPFSIIRLRCQACSKRRRPVASRDAQTHPTPAPLAISIPA